jgi:hypothetical protein
MYSQLQLTSSPVTNIVQLQLTVLAAGMRPALALPELLDELRADSTEQQHERGEAAVRILCRTRAQANAAIQVPWLDEVSATLQMPHRGPLCTPLRAGETIFFASWFRTKIIGICLFDAL